MVDKYTKQKAPDNNVKVLDALKTIRNTGLAHRDVDALGGLNDSMVILPPRGVYQKKLEELQEMGLSGLWQGAKALYRDSARVVAILVFVVRQEIHELERRRSSHYDKA